MKLTGKIGLIYINQQMQVNWKCSVQNVERWQWIQEIEFSEMTLRKIHSSLLANLSCNSSQIKIMKKPSVKFSKEQVFSYRSLVVKNIVCLLPHITLFHQLDLLWTMRCSFYKDKVARTMLLYSNLYKAHIRNMTSTRMWVHMMKAYTQDAILVLLLLNNLEEVTSI